MDYELLSSLKFFLGKIFAKNKYDLIVTIEKTGHRLFYLAMENGLVCNIPIFTSLGVREENLKNKKILLFDDRINSGKTILKVKENLLNMGANDVETAVYAADENSTENINYFHQILNDNNKHEYRESVSEITENLPYPYYTDHLFIGGIIEGDTFSTNVFKQSLDGLGRAYEVKYKHKKNDNFPVKISLEDLTFFDIESMSTDEYDLKKDIWKLRFHLTNSGDITITPFALPEILQKKSYPKLHSSFKYCLCKNHQKNPIILRSPTPEWTLCSYCLVFNFDVLMLTYFLEKWKDNLSKLGLKFVITSFTNEHNENIFKDSQMTDYLIDNLFGEE